MAGYWTVADQHFATKQTEDVSIIQAAQRSVTCDGGEGRVIVCNLIAAQNKSREDGRRGSATKEAGRMGDWLGQARSRRNPCFSFSSHSKPLRWGWFHSHHWHLQQWYFIPDAEEQLCFAYIYFRTLSYLGDSFQDLSLLSQAFAVWHQTTQTHIRFQRHRFHRHDRWLCSLHEPDQSLLVSVSTPELAGVTACGIDCFLSARPCDPTFFVNLQRQRADCFLLKAPQLCPCHNCRSVQVESWKESLEPVQES